MHFLVTGGAGFIGSNLVDHLLSAGHIVTALDDFSTGFREFIGGAAKRPNFRLSEASVLDPRALGAAMQGVDFVFHLSANADVRFGTDHPRKDLEQNIIATFNVLEAMRTNGVKEIAFSSTGSIYGETKVIPTPEDAPFPVQTSLYGASKLAGEGLVEAYCEGFGCRGFIFRFVSVLGERYTHGHVFDFYKSLRKNPHSLQILGNGKQRKSYLYIQDIISAMMTALQAGKDKINIYNLGQTDYIEVNDSVRWITAHLGLTPRLTYSGGERGWVGDNPFIFLDTQLIRSLGWEPKVSIRDSVIRTLDWLCANSWILDRRS